jgi:esterase/lipase superfamily enzyme
MGAHIAAQAIQTHAEGVAISEVVLQAPDIGRVDYPALASALTSRSRRVTVYTNRFDKALSGSSVTSGFERVGSDVMYAIFRGVDAIDASNMGDGTWWRHGYAFRAPLLLDLRGTLDGVNQVRAQLERRVHAIGDYYTFKPVSK